jgi:uncharacterized protein YkvS
LSHSRKTYSEKRLLGLAFPGNILNKKKGLKMLKQNENDIFSVTVMNGFKGFPITQTLFCDLKQAIIYANHEQKLLQWNRVAMLAVEREGRTIEIIYLTQLKKKR